MTSCFSPRTHRGCYFSGSTCNGRCGVGRRCCATNIGGRCVRRCVNATSTAPKEGSCPDGSVGKPTLGLRWLNGFCRWVQHAKVVDDDDGNGNDEDDETDGSNDDADNDNEDTMILTIITMKMTCVPRNDNQIVVTEFCFGSLSLNFEKRLMGCDIFIVNFFLHSSSTLLLFLLLYSNLISSSPTLSSSFHSSRPSPTTAG